MLHEERVKTVSKINSTALVKMNDKEREARKTKMKTIIEAGKKV